MSNHFNSAQTRQTENLQNVFDVDVAFDPCHFFLCGTTKMFDLIANIEYFRATLMSA